MTQAIETVRIVYLGSGSPGPFAFNALVNSTMELCVEHYDTDGIRTPLSYPSDYSVSGIGTNSVEITLLDDLETGEKLAIYRLASMVSTLDLNLGGASRPISMEEQIDRLSRLTQDLKERLDRALLVDARGTAEGGAIDGKGVRLANIDTATEDDDATPLAQIQSLIATALGAVDGEDGEQGPAGTITIGTVETLDPNEPAYVENVGTPEEAILNIGIPRGLQGTSGLGTGDLLSANNLSDVGSPATAFANIKQAASLTATGVVELATVAEHTTGTDETRAATPKGVKSVVDAAITAIKNGVDSAYDTLAEIATALATFAVKSNNLSDLSSASSARTNLGLGTSAVLDTGTTANKVVQLDGSAKLPAVDGSQLTGISSVVKQTVYAQTATQGTLGTTTIPLDATIPQSGEGYEILTVTITPTNSSSKLRISGQITIGMAPPFEGTSLSPIVAVFKDSDASAIFASLMPVSTSLNMFFLRFSFDVSAGSTSERTYKMRAGGSDSLTAYLNRSSSIAPLGGVIITNLQVDEMLNPA